MDHTFEVSSFFLIGYTDTQEQAKELCRAMPVEFHSKGHFTIGPTCEYKRYVISWDCHALSSSRPLLKLPFKVSPPRNSWDY